MMDAEEHPIEVSVKHLDDARPKTRKIRRTNPRTHWLRRWEECINDASAV